MLLLFAIAHIPLPQGFTPPDIMTSALSRLLILGTIILGLLSGFGAISNSWGFIPFLASSRPAPTDQQISSAEYSLAAIRNNLRERRAAAAEPADSPADSSWLSRVSATFRPKGEVEQEIRGLEALEYEMVRRMESLREARDAANFSASWRGKVFNIIGHLFAIYCVVRIFSVCPVYSPFTFTFRVNFSLVVGKHTPPRSSHCLLRYNLSRYNQRIACIYSFLDIYKS